jgi:hypothetical protein
VPDDLEFTVEEWTPDEASIHELLARAANSTIAKGAYLAAVKMRPTALILLRHGARVLERSAPSK